jgi:hypothetical protein
MVLGVIGLACGHCKSGGVALFSPHHTSAPAPLSRPGAWHRRD